MGKKYYFVGMLYCTAFFCVVNLTISFPQFIIYAHMFKI